MAYPRSGSVLGNRFLLGVACVLATMCALPADAAPGDLDTTFGASGKVTLALPGSSDNGSSMVQWLPAAGQLIVAGTIQQTSTSLSFFSSRVGASGIIDSTYGTSGYSALTIPNMRAAVGVRDMFVQADGKVLVVGDFGGVNSGNSILGVARLATSGTGDSTFNATGTPGYNAVNFGFAGGIFTRKVRVQSDGKILVVGGSGFSSRPTVVRFNANGSVDATYGSSGHAVVATVPGQGRAMDIASDGGAVVASATSSLNLAKLSASGAADTTFGTAGSTSFTPPAGLSFLQVVEVRCQPDGHILVTTTATSSTDSGFLTVRFSSGGALDTTFGAGHGWIFAHVSDTPSGILMFQSAQTPNGKIVIAGNDGSVPIVVRLSADGSGDPAFGVNGVYRYTGATNLSGVAVADDGSLFLSGNAGTSEVLFKTSPDVTATSVAHLANISTRGAVGTANDVLIGGFIIGGTTSKTVVVVGTGPSLVSAGIANPLPNPTLTLVRSSDRAIIAANDDWGNAPNAAQIQAAGFAPVNTLESAIMMTLPPGAYTAILADANGNTGAGVVAVYEVDHPETPLVNISTRGQVLTGNDVMIGGVIISGSQAQTVIITGIGPSLTAAGITNPLPNPTLTLVRSADGAVIATNDDWATSPNAAQMQAAGLAPASSLESAIMVTLSPGAYTAILSDASGGTGIGIIAAYAR